MGCNNPDVKSKGCIRIMASLHKQLHWFCVGNTIYLFLSGECKTVVLSVSCHPSPSAAGFAGYSFLLVWVLFTFFAPNPTWSLSLHTVVGLVKRSMLEYHKKESKRWKLSGPKCFESSSADVKRAVSIPSTLLEMHYILLPRQFVILVHGFSALLGFVITFK